MRRRTVTRPHPAARITWLTVLTVCALLGSLLPFAPPATADSSQEPVLGAGNYQMTAIVDGSAAGYAFDAQNVAVALTPLDGSSSGATALLCTDPNHDCGEGAVGQLALSASQQSALQVSLQSPGITNVGGNNYSLGTVTLQSGDATIQQLGPLSWSYTWHPEEPLVGGGQFYPPIVVYIDVESYAGPPPGGTGSAGNGGPSAHRGDPVNSLTGSLFHQRTTAAVRDAKLPLSETLSYNSFQPEDDGFGYGWSGSYSRHLAFYPSAVVAVLDDGTQLRFALQTLTPLDGTSGQLTSTASGYVLNVGDGQVSDFDSSGVLQRVRTLDGQVDRVQYDAAAHLSAVTGASQSITFGWDGSHLTSATLNDGRAATFSYDSAGDLMSAADTAGNTESYTYDAGHRLQTITAADGTTTLSTTYDEASGRVISQTDGNGNSSAFSTIPEGNQVVALYHPAGPVTAQDTYSPSGQLTNVNGNALSYDASGRLAAISVGTPTGPGHVESFTYDTAGDTTSVTTPAGVATYLFNASRQLVSTQIGAQTSSASYDTQNRVSSVTTAQGTTTYSYSGSSPQPTRITSPGGGYQDFAYDPAGNMTTITGPTGHQTHLEYDSDNRVVSVTDPRGTTAGTDPAGHTTTYAYTADDLLATSTDPLGALTQYGYDTFGDLTTSTDPLGRTTTRSYDSDGNLKLLTLPGGQQTTDTYDAAGHVTSSTDPLGRTTQQTWDPNTGQLTSRTSPSGGTTAYTYDGDGNVIRTVDPDGHTTTNTYDASDRLSATTTPNGNRIGSDPRENTTTYTYDSSGNRTSLMNGNGAVTKYAYDDAGNLISTTDPLGRTSRTDYDAAGRVLAEHDPTGATTSSRYDAAGQLVSTTDPLGNTTTYTYDADGNRLSLTDPSGDLTTYGYDADNRLVATTSPRGNAPQAAAGSFTSTNSYDAAGQRTATTNALGGVTTISYDAAGDKATETDPAGRTTNYGYDDAGEPVAITNPLGDQTSLTYDADGNVSGRTDGLGHTTHYSWDGDGLQIGKVTPLGESSSYQYDADQNLIQTVTPPTANGSSRTTNYTFDGQDRLTHVAYDQSASAVLPGAGGSTTTVSIPTPNVSYTYDAADQLTQIVDGVGTTHYQYDPARRLVKTTGAHALSIGYDAAGHRTSLTYPDNAADRYTYDSDGRLSTQAVAGLPTQAFRYNADSEPTGRVGGGLQVAWTRDALGKTLEMTTRNSTQQILDLRQSFTAAGQLATRSISAPQQQLQPAISALAATNPDAVNPAASLFTQDGYTYNAAGELTQDCRGACSASTSGAWTYDAAGNRTTQTGAAASSTYTYNADNELTALTTSGGSSTTFTYDTQGNQTQKVVNTTGVAGTGVATTATTNYVYDGANHLALELAGSTGVEYTYDAQGDRARTQHVQATSAGLTATNSQSATWDPASGRPELLQDAGGTTGLQQHRYSYAAGALTAVVTNGTASQAGSPRGTVSQFAVTDDLTSPIAYTEPDGTLDATASYDAWGNGTSQARTASGVTDTGAGTTATAPPEPAVGYAGGQTADDRTVHMGARDLDPATGRFQAPDPLATGVNETQQWNASNYLYVRDDPLDLVDPLGLQEHKSGAFQWFFDLVDTTKFVSKAVVNFTVNVGPGLYDGLSGALNSSVHGYCEIVTNDVVTCEQTNVLPYLTGYCPFQDDSLTASCEVGNATGAVLPPALLDGASALLALRDASDARSAIRVASPPTAAEGADAAAVDVGHAGIHQFPGITAGKSQFFDGANLGQLSNTDGLTGVVQQNGNLRYVLRGAGDVGVDRTTGLPTDIYTVIRKPDGSVLTMFPGASPKS